MIIAMHRTNPSSRSGPDSPHDQRCRQATSESLVANQTTDHAEESDTDRHSLRKIKDEVMMLKATPPTRRARTRIEQADC